MNFFGACQGAKWLTAGSTTVFEPGIRPAASCMCSGREELRALFTALLELPERNRNIFVLFRFEKMQKPEIARRLGVSLSAVEKNLVRATDHLCNRLGRPRR